MMVLVRGKNLQTVVFAIENGMADFIQELISSGGRNRPTPPRHH